MIGVLTLYMSVTYRCYLLKGTCSHYKSQILNEHLLYTALIKSSENIQVEGTSSLEDLTTGQGNKT